MRPDITKVLFRKIKVAQERVLDQSSRIEHAEKSIQETKAEIDDFELDPAAYAFRRYGARNGVDSYPVVTRLNMLREKLDRYIERRPIRAAALHDAACALAAIEAETLQAALLLAPSTARVPWPATLPAFIGHEEVTRVDADVLVAAQQINEAEQRGFALELARRKNEDARAHHGIAEALEQRRKSAPPAVSERSSQIVLANGLAFTVTYTSIDGPGILQEAISRDQAGPFVGRTWDLASAIFRSGVDWPGWQAYHKRFRQACGTGLEHHASENETSADYSRRVEHIRKVSRQHYCPEGVRLPVFVDGSPAKPSQLRAFVQGLGFSDEQAEDWFLKTRFAGRIGTGRPLNYGPETLAAMECVGLLCRGSSIATADAIGLLTYSELKAAMVQLGLKPGRSIGICRSAIVELSLGRHDEVRQAVSKHGQKDAWVVRPPAAMSWTEFQSWRQQIRGMAEAITDLYWGKQVPARDREVLLA